MENLKLSKRKQLYNYLLQSIDFQWYDNTENTLENVFNTCKSEYWHINNDYKRTFERLLGLPSCLNIDFSYYNIQQLMNWFWYKTQNVFKLSDMYRNSLARFIVDHKKHQ